MTITDSNGYVVDMDILSEELQDMVDDRATLWGQLDAQLIKATSDAHELTERLKRLGEVGFDRDTCLCCKNALAARDALAAQLDVLRAQVRDATTLAELMAKAAALAAKVDALEAQSDALAAKVDVLRDRIRDARR